MPSDVDIVNRALRNIGANRITALTDGTKSANVANDVYQQVFDDLLRSANWKFATRQAQLSRLATTPTYEFDYAYALPDDWVRTIDVRDNDAGTGQIAYREAEVDNVGVILASVEQVYLRYVYQVTDVNRCSRDFHTALAYSLASEMAISLEASNTLHEAMTAKATRAIMKAKSSDALSTPADARPAGSWATSRGQWPSSRWPR